MIGLPIVWYVSDRSQDRHNNTLSVEAVVLPTCCVSCFSYVDTGSTRYSSLRNRSDRSLFQSLVSEAFVAVEWSSQRLSEALAVCVFPELNGGCWAGDYGNHAGGLLGVYGTTWLQWLACRVSVVVDRCTPILTASTHSLNARWVGGTHMHVHTWLLNLLILRNGKLKFPRSLSTRVVR